MREGSSDVCYFDSKRPCRGRYRQSHISSRCGGEGWEDRQDRICADRSGEKAIDGTGKVLAPGFIDAHSHLDKRIEAVPHCAHLLKQGVTTVIGGMCGGSAAPISQEHFDDGLRVTGKNHSEESIRARLSLDSDIRHLKTIPLGSHFTFLAGHGNIRVAAMGAEAPKYRRERCILTHLGSQKKTLMVFFWKSFLPPPFTGSFLTVCCRQPFGCRLFCYLKIR